MQELLTRQQLEEASRCLKKKSCADCGMEKICKSPYLCEYELLGKTALALLDMLERLEYSNLTWEGSECAICGEMDTHGHSPDCELGQLLEKMRE